MHPSKASSAETSAPPRFTSPKSSSHITEVFSKVHLRIRLNKNKSAYVPKHFAKRVACRKPNPSSCDIVAVPNDSASLSAISRTGRFCDLFNSLFFEFQWLTRHFSNRTANVW